ncbi:MAG TPA: hypothetical protein VFR33_03800 [Candidatus Dormibacteraeota bacterium]|nr:hypothetical protein [Candidatus Dormibacteraeota bacterium]
MRKLFIGLAALALMTSCGSQPVASTTPTPQSSPSSSAAASPTPSAAPSPTIPAGFAFQDFSGGSVSGNDVVSVTIGQHPGYDRIVIQFASDIPSYSATRQSNSTFTRSPKGDQVTLQGSAGVLIVVHSVTNWTSYGGPTSFDAGYPYMKEVQMVENFEGYQQWALGVQGEPALRVMTLTNPSRLVVDVAVAG